MAKVTTQLFGELAILPHPAEAPVRENLEFLTDVIEAYDSSEQAIQLRSKPRQSFNYTVPLQSWRTAAAFNTEYGALRKDWAVPIWTEGQFVGTVAAGLTSLACDTSLYDLRSQSLAMLYSVSGEYQVIEINAATVGNITLLSPTIALTNAWLLPVRKGWINGNVSKPTNGHNGKSSIAFVIDDNPVISPAVPAQYLGNDIYYEAPLLNGASLEASLSQQQDVADMALGPVERRTNWLHPQFGKPWRSLLTTPQEVRAYREFLYRRAGRFRRFWFPSFENNLRITTNGLVTSTFVMFSDSFIEYATQRTHIAFHADGVWYPRAITNAVQTDADHVQITLSSALNIQSNRISKVCYLGLHRFDADRMELNWQGGGVMESNVPVLELTP